MTHPLHRDVESLLRCYARDLDALVPSKSLDARIDALVAAGAGNLRGHPAHPAPAPHGGLRRRTPSREAGRRWVLAAALGTLAVALGVVIGVRVERAAMPAPGSAIASRTAPEPAWPPPDFALWPTDSVALKIPAEVSPRGTLVAVDGNTHTGGARYWVDIVVSNDGTVRIENIVPAGETKQPEEGSHGVSTQKH
jgi:hypothetical protein